jgi:hypothetical protein
MRNGEAVASATASAETGHYGVIHVAPQAGDVLRLATRPGVEYLIAYDGAPTIELSCRPAPYAPTLEGDAGSYEAGALILGPTSGAGVTISGGRYSRDLGGLEPVEGQLVEVSLSKRQGPLYVSSIHGQTVSACGPQADDAPVATCDGYWVKEHGTLAISPKQGALANDFDPNDVPIAAKVLRTNFAAADHPYSLKPTGALTFGTRATPKHRPFVAMITYRAVNANGLESSPTTIRIYIQPDKPSPEQLHPCGKAGGHGAAAKRSAKPSCFRLPAWEGLHGVKSEVPGGRAAPVKKIATHFDLHLIVRVGKRLTSLSPAVYTHAVEEFKVVGTAAADLGARPAFVDSFGHSGELTTSFKSGHLTIVNYPKGVGFSFDTDRQAVGFNAQAGALHSLFRFTPAAPLLAAQAPTGLLPKDLKIKFSSQAQLGIRDGTTTTTQNYASSSSSVSIDLKKRYRFDPPKEWGWTEIPCKAYDGS